MSVPSNDAAISGDLERIAGSLFFIVGTGRCGSTLLQAMLSAHPRLSIPPETHFFFRFDPAIWGDDPLTEAHVAAYLGRVTPNAHLQRLGIDPARLAAAVTGGIRSARLLLPWMLTELHRAADGGNEAVRFGEKSPSHQEHMARIARVFPEAKFIHIHRDPRDVVASLNDMPWWAPRPAAANARYWRRVVNHQEHWARMLGPGRHCTVSYEKLIAAPEAELRRLCSFLGEEFDERMLRYHERTEPRRTYLAAESSWKSLAATPLDSSRIARYRGKLTDREIRAVERIASVDLMRRLGYKPDPEAADHWSWPIRDGVSEFFRRLRREMLRLSRRKSRAAHKLH